LKIVVNDQTILWNTVTNAQVHAGERLRPTQAALRGRLDRGCGHRHAPPFIGSGSSSSPTPTSHRPYLVQDIEEYQDHCDLVRAFYQSSDFGGGAAALGWCLFDGYIRSTPLCLSIPSTTLAFENPPSTGSKGRSPAMVMFCPGSFFRMVFNLTALESHCLGRKGSSSLAC
jgi:pimeloyl-ACP methyl ester carboxylesterase